MAGWRFCEGWSRLVLGGRCGLPRQCTASLRLRYRSMQKEHAYLVIPRTQSFLSCTALLLILAVPWLLP